MNLAKKTSETELQTLLASADDNSGSHVLWVENNGEVHLDNVSRSVRLADGQPIWFGPKARFRWETFCQGNDYVGPKAAGDPEWVSKLYREIVYLWEIGFTGYSDYWQAPS